MEALFSGVRPSNALCGDVPRPPKTRFWVGKCVLLALKGILFAKLISVCPNQTFFVYFRSVLAEKKWIQSNLVHYLSVLYGDLVILVILGWNCRFYLYVTSWLHGNGNFDESSVGWYTIDTLLECCYTQYEHMIFFQGHQFYLKVNTTIFNYYRRALIPAFLSSERVFYSQGTVWQEKDHC